MGKIWIGDNPTKAYLYPTIRCNLKCKACYSGGNTSLKKNINDELSLDEYKKLVDDLYDIGIRYFDISGGEPFLCDFLYDLIRYIKTYPDTVVLLVSNGTLISKVKDINFDVIRQIDRLYISIDSPIEDIHNQIRNVPKAFQCTLEGIETLIKNDVSNVGINFLLLKQNYLQVEEMINLACHYKIKYINLLRYINVSGEANNSDSLEAEDYDNLYRNLVTYVNNNRNNKDVTIDEIKLVMPGFYFNNYIKNRSQIEKGKSMNIAIVFDPIRGCPAFGDSLVISSEGDVTGCTALIKNPFFYTGNVRKDRLSSIISKNKEWREKIKMRENKLHLESPCSNCDEWLSCRGGCPAEIYSITHGIECYNHICGKLY